MEHQGRGRRRGGGSRTGEGARVHAVRTGHGDRGAADDNIIVTGGRQGDTTSAGDDVDLTLKASSASVEVRCPVDTDVVVGTASGSVTCTALGAAAGHDRERVDPGRVRRLRRTAHAFRPHRGRRVPGSCRVMNTSGRVEVHRAGEVEVKAVSGIVEASGDDVHVRTVSGKVRIDTNVDASVETVSGKVEVWVPPGFHPAGARPGPRPRGHRRAAGERRRDLRAHRQRIGTGAVAVTTTAEAPAPVVWGAVLFTDLVGFTEFTASRGTRGGRAPGPPGADRRGGPPRGFAVVRELGDGLLLWFPDADSALSTASTSRRGSRRSRRRPVSRCGCGWACTGGTRPAAATTSSDTTSMSRLGSSTSRGPARCCCPTPPRHAGQGQPDVCFDDSVRW